jgi:flagellar basal body-associated protein FliL
MDTPLFDVPATTSAPGFGTGGGSMTILIIAAAVLVAAAVVILAVITTRRKRANRIHAQDASTGEKT